MKRWLRSLLGLNATELFHAREITSLRRDLRKAERQIDLLDQQITTVLVHLVAVLERYAAETEEAPCPCQTRGQGFDWTETHTEG